ncbi:MAG TPA: hypothetical protein VEI94_11430 [Candidatus Bathyarchaeia archaeon]|nr:hypothetical protein [Candidatus Bathyarchaeia archaeon]
MILAGLSACTSINTSSVKSHRDAGTKRSYDRPAGDLYDASLLAIHDLQQTEDWKELTITEQDRDRGVIIAERHLDSRVIPGVGMKDAFGIFIDAQPYDRSEVTVVRMSSDQVPGDVGTSVGSFTRGEGVLFPAIDAALATIPRKPSTEAPAQTAAAAPPAAGVQPSRSVAPVEHGAPPAARQAQPPIAPSAAAAQAGPGSAGALMDRVYQQLRASGEWRPLVREVGESGAEEIRIGKWARITTDGSRVALHVREAKGAAASSARLALELSQAGFQVDVQEEGPEHR